MNSTTIMIDGNKFKTLIEKTTGKTIYAASRDAGFSTNTLANSATSGKASAAIQNYMRLLGIEPEAYKLKEERVEAIPEERKQLSFDDMTSEAIKTAVKEALKEALPDVVKACGTTSETGIRAAFKAGYKAGYHEALNNKGEK